MKLWACCMFGFFVVLSMGRAQAFAEFCPATVTAFRAIDPATATYAYRLDAFGPRTIQQAKLVADTDLGWYEWTVAGVGLTSQIEKVDTPYMHGDHVVGRSADQFVQFPDNVRVRHAWVLAAQAAGDTIFDWDAQGLVGCNPPPFEDDPRRAARVQSAVSSSPPPLPPSGAVRATKSSIAYRGRDCAVPFAQDGPIHAVPPEYPTSARDLQIGEVAAVAEVAVDPNGKASDAWIYATSGWQSIDNATLETAKATTYRAAISYCETTGSFYLFRALFRPD